jgi:hypothetical protein
MQRVAGLSSPAAFVRSRWTEQGSTRSRAVLAGGALLGALFAFSLVLGPFFAKAGITPGSILLCAVVVGVASTCGNDLLHPARLLAAILALGFVIGPVVHSLTDVYSLPDGSERQRAELGRATWMVLAGALLAFLLMHATLGVGWRADLRSEGRASLSRRTMLAAVGVAATGFVLLVLYLLLTGRSSISLQGRGATYAVIPDEGRKAYLGLLAPIGLGGLLVIAAWALERGSRSTLLVSSAAAAGFGVLMALPGSRANFLYAVAPLFFLYVGYRGFPPWRWLAVAVASLVVLLSYGASLRTADARSALLEDPWKTLSENGPRRDNLERFFVVDVAHTEPLLGAMDAFPATRPFLGGESAALGFTGPVGWKLGQLIGLRIDPPAGVTLTAAAYARDPSTFESGLTATLPGELYANAGVFGLLVGLAAFGAVAGWIRRLAVFSRAPGALALYAAAMTILFAVFSDYFGQIYRGGAIVIGVGLALAAGGQKTFPLARVTVIAGLLALGAAMLLFARRYVGAPPATLMTSFASVYLTFVGLGIFTALRLNASRRAS